MQTDVGYGHAQTGALVISNNKLKYFEIRATSWGKDYTYVGSNKDVYSSCYNFTQNFIAKAPQGLKNVKYAAEYFV